jgi:enoyl-CoA hydratase/carnithine racemase
MSEAPAILVETADHIATITLNRPHKLNAWSVQMRQEVADALAAAEDDSDIRAVILTGAGRAFCAGADMSEGRLEGRDSLLRLEYATRGPSYVLARMDTPVIAAINGPAIGAGFEIALGCDFRIMAETATLNDLHVSRGLLADAGAPWLLPRLVGWERACEMLLLGEPVDSATAKQLGLVGRVVPPDQLMPAARTLAGRLASKAPLAVRAMKRLMRDGLNREQRPSMEFSARLFRELQQSEDLKEGVRAWIEKRPPNWQGR